MTSYIITHFGRDKNGRISFTKMNEQEVRQQVEKYRAVGNIEKLDRYAGFLREFQKSQKERK